MKGKLAALIFGIVFAMFMSSLIGWSIGNVDTAGYDLRLSDLNWQLEKCKENTAFWHNEAMIDEPSDTDKALLEVAKKFAELKSANITIETTDAKIHIEWER